MLSTVSVFQANRVEVNDVIYEIAQDFDNVRVLDWAGETAEYPVLTGGDGLHLTDLGRARFADMVAEELGDAPGFGERSSASELVHRRLGRHGEHRTDRGSGHDAADTCRRTPTRTRSRRTPGRPSRRRTIRTPPVGTDATRRQRSAGHRAAAADRPTADRRRRRREPPPPPTEPPTVAADRAATVRGSTP